MLSNRVSPWPLLLFQFLYGGEPSVRRHDGLPVGGPGWEVFEADLFEETSYLHKHPIGNSSTEQVICLLLCIFCYL